MKRKILIMGLPGSGKTTLARELAKRLKAAWFNADLIRENINKDLGWSIEDRVEQAKRMGKICDWASFGGNYVIADFVCPTQETRKAFNADIVIYIERIKEGRFENTNKIFTPPEKPDLILRNESLEDWLNKSIKKINFINYGGRGGS